MSDQHFLSSAAPADVFGSLHGGERVMWRGRCGVAEYAFDEAASLPRWTLPETTDVLVTDDRVLYAYTADDGLQVRSGELRWLWPQHLRVQPGARSTDRGAAATQIQLVCAGADGTYPALVFAGGDLATVADADRLANIVRQAVARFRVDNVAKLGLGTGQTRMLSRLLIGPEFRNHQGGEGQTVSLVGALLVSRPVPAPALDAEPAARNAAVPAELTALEAAVPAEPVTFDAAEPAVLDAGGRAGRDAEPAFAAEPSSALDAPFLAEIHTEPESKGNAFAEAARAAGFAQDEGMPERRPIAEGTRLIAYRPGRAADAARALMAAKAEEDAQQSEPATASRAAELAARVANLVSRTAEPAEIGPAPVTPEPLQVTVHQSPAADRRTFGARLTELRASESDRHAELPASESDRYADLRPSEAGRHTEDGSGRYTEPVGWHAEARIADSWHAEPGPVAADHPGGPAGDGTGATGRFDEDRFGRRRFGGYRPGEERLDTTYAERIAAQRLSPERIAAERAAAQRVEADRIRAERGDGQRFEAPTTTNLAQRAESIRRTAARMAANAARSRIGTRRADRESGISTRGNHNP